MLDVVAPQVIGTAMNKVTIRFNFNIDLNKLPVPERLKLQIHGIGVAPLKNLSTFSWDDENTSCISTGLVGATGLEPATSCSQSTHATNCATPRQTTKIAFFSPGSKYR